MLPTDLERLILRFAAAYYPWMHMRRLDQRVLSRHHRLVRHVEDSFGPYAWSPTFCNVLNWTWINPTRNLLLDYSAVTHMTPTRKMRIDEFRREVGYAPIFPGDLHYPTSRVRFDPKFHTNDRYFR